MRDLHAALSGVPPRICVEAPITEVTIYKALDAHTEKTHEAVLCSIHCLRMLQLPAFYGSSPGVTDEDPTVGVNLIGWNSVEVRRDPAPSRLYGN